MKHKDLKIDFRYLIGNTACLSVDSISGEPIHNDINNEEAIIIFNSLVGEKEDCQTVKKLLKNKEQLKEQQQQEFIDYLEEEKDRLAGEISAIYENDLDETKLVNEDIFNEINKILSKYKEIIGLENE